jgi:hypothetical protein
MPNTEQFQGVAAQMKPMLQNLSTIQGVGGVGGSKIRMTWNPEKMGPDIALSNENLTVTRTDSSGWGCQLSEQSISCGCHYYEFTIDRNGSTCLLLGVADQRFTNLSSKSSGNNVYALQSDGDMYFNGNGKGQVWKYEQGDKLGLLVNIEERNMIYFKNG